MMPVMNGFQFLAEIKKHQDWKNIPVVVLTAMDLPEQGLVQLDKMVNHVFRKGEYAKDDLVSTVKKLLEKTEKGQQGKAA